MSFDMRVTVGVLGKNHARIAAEHIVPEVWQDEYGGTVSVHRDRNALGEPWPDDKNGICLSTFKARAAKAIALAANRIAFEYECELNLAQELQDFVDLVAQLTEKRGFVHIEAN